MTNVNLKAMKRKQRYTNKHVKRNQYHRLEGLGLRWVCRKQAVLWSHMLVPLQNVSRTFSHAPDLGWQPVPDISILVPMGPAGASGTTSWDPAHRWALFSALSEGAKGRPT